MSLPPRPRIVLDTNVCLALFLYADPACARLAALLDACTAVANQDTRDEWRRVLQTGRFPFDAERHRQAAAAWDARVDIVECAAVSTVLPRCRDADDQKFLELARDAGAQTLYTRDRELLKLSRRTLRMAGFAVLPPEHALGVD